MSITSGRPMTFEARIARRPELLELAPWGSVCVLELCVEHSHEPPRRARARWRGLGTRRAIVLGEHARRIAPYLYPTRRVVIHGRPQSVSWESPLGDERHANCLIAERVQLLGPPPPDMRRRAAPASHPSVPAEHARVCTQRELSPTCRR